jgi:hypothetical protein
MEDKLLVEEKYTRKKQQMTKHTVPQPSYEIHMQLTTFNILSTALTDFSIKLPRTAMAFKCFYCWSSGKKMPLAYCHPMCSHT